VTHPFPPSITTNLRRRSGGVSVGTVGATAGCASHAGSPSCFRYCGDVASAGCVIIVAGEFNHLALATAGGARRRINLLKAAAKPRSSPRSARLRKLQYFKNRFGYAVGATAQSSVHGTLHRTGEFCRNNPARCDPLLVPSALRRMPQLPRGLDTRQIPSSARSG
jgi:hypothetical protein